MSPEMITALGAFALGIASIVSAILLNRKTLALLEFRMKEVEKKLDMHNKWGARFEEIEKAIISIQKDVEYIKNK